MALLQPPPEVYELFNDVLLLSEGAGVGPPSATQGRNLFFLPVSILMSLSLHNTRHADQHLKRPWGHTRGPHPNLPYALASRAGGVLGAAHRRGALLRVDGLPVPGAQGRPRLPAGGQLREGPGGAHPGPVSPTTSRACLRWPAWAQAPARQEQHGAVVGAWPDVCMSSGRWAVSRVHTFCLQSGREGSTVSHQVNAGPFARHCAFFRRGGRGAQQYWARDEPYAYVPVSAFVERFQHSPPGKARSPGTLQPWPEHASQPGVSAPSFAVHGLAVGAKAQCPRSMHPHVHAQAKAICRTTARC